MTQLEIAVTTARGARAALAGGADRVELCSALELGGISPSTALIEHTVAVGLPVHVLIRCRPGDFVYNEDDIALMEREIAISLSSGAQGVVLGALTPQGDIDTVALTRMIHAARVTTPTCVVTAHRAVDEAKDYAEATRTVTTLGVDRILTSGGMDSAGDGLDNLTALRRAHPDVQIMAGGGVTRADVPALVWAGVDAIHASAKRAVAPRWHGTTRLGVAADANASVSHYETTESIVRDLHDALSVPQFRHTQDRR